MNVAEALAVCVHALSFKSGILAVKTARYDGWPYKLN